MKKHLSALVLAVAGALILSACGGKNTSAVDNQKETQIAEQAVAEESEETIEETVSEPKEQEVEEVVEEAETSDEEVTEASDESSEDASKVTLEDGEYLADFKTDSSMFKAHETTEGSGTLTVKDGEMTFHVILSGDGILNLYVGVSDDAKNNTDDLLNPEKVTVKFEDGMEEEVNAYDIPVPVIDEEFDCALIGKKGKWYDHKIQITNVREKE